MFPLRDNIGTNRFPIITAALIVACTLIFLFEISRPATTLPGYRTGIQRAVSGFDRVTAEWGFVPCELVHRCKYPGRADLSSPDGGTAEVRVAQHSPWLTLFASIFMHGGWLHIVGNMLFLWIFGNNVEDRMGRFRYLLFYLVCGLVAAFSQLATDPSSGVPNIGASGAIAGVLGAYIVLYPRARVLTAITLLVFFAIVEVPAILLLGAWFLLQVLDGSAGLVSAGEGGVAYFAHVGGFVAGPAAGVAARARKAAPRARDLTSRVGDEPVAGRPRSVLAQPRRGQIGGRVAPSDLVDPHGSLGEVERDHELEPRVVPEEGRAHRARQPHALGLEAATGLAVPTRSRGDRAGVAAAVERGSGDPAQVGRIGLSTANGAETIRLRVRLGHLGLELASRRRSVRSRRRSLSVAWARPCESRSTSAARLSRSRSTDAELRRQPREPIARALELECTRLGLGPRAARAHELALHRLELGLEPLDQAVAHHGGLGAHRIGVHAQRLLARGLGRLPARAAPRRPGTRRRRVGTSGRLRRGKGEPPPLAGSGAGRPRSFRDRQRRPLAGRWYPISA